MKKDTVLKILIFIVVAIIAVAMSSCKTRIIEVPVENTKYVYVKDTLKERSIEYDSIYVNDSTYIEKYDSLLREFKGHYEIRYKLLTDTVEKIKEVHDSTRVEVPVRVEVEKELSGWQKFILAVGPWCFWILLLILIAIIVRVILKIYTRR